MGKLIGLVMACGLGIAIYYGSRAIIHELGWLAWLALVASSIWYISVFNVLVEYRNSIQESWSQIDVELKRRFDLVGNLVETVKGYAGHEKGVMETVTRFRSIASGETKSTAEEVESQNMLTGVLKTLFAVAEAYPQLKADAVFLALQNELSSIEASIASERSSYNRQVRDYNTTCQSFFSHIVAVIHGFAPQNYLQIAEAVSEPVRVSF